VGQANFSASLLPTQPSPFVILQGDSAHFQPIILKKNRL
jgi:hypothetical protein